MSYGDIPDWVHAFDALNMERATVEQYETYIVYLMGKRLDGQTVNMTWEKEWADGKLASSLARQGGSSPQQLAPSAAQSDPRRCKP